MKKLLLMSLLAVAMTLIFSCSQRVEISDALLDGVPEIFPDYSDVTVPRNIAPLNFSYLGSEECRLVVNGNIQLRGGSNGLFSFPPSLWRKLVREPQVKLQIAVKQDGQWKAYRPFRIYVSQDEIDPFLSYRLIPPGYGGWKLMGLYQRNLLSYRQTPIYENRLGEDNCVNCHTPKDRDSRQAVFHARAIFGGTYVIDDGRIEKLDTKTDSTISNLVYPFWHPSGKYIAFSVNATKQSFFNHDPNRIEVFDSASDIVVYDVGNHSICWSPLTKSSTEFETFPAFSPDGKYLYFCSARAVEKMPEDYAKAKYNLKRIASCSRSTVTETSASGTRMPTYGALILRMARPCRWMLSIPTMSKATIPGAGIHVGWSSAAGATTDSTPDSSFRMSTVKGMHRSHFSFRRRIQGNITRICYIPTTFRNS